MLSKSASLMKELKAEGNSELTLPQGILDIFSELQSMILYHTIGFSDLLSQITT